MNLTKVIVLSIFSNTKQYLHHNLDDSIQYLFKIANIYEKQATITMHSNENMNLLVYNLNP